MMEEKRIYIDSNIYIDLFENREDKLEPWSEFALDLIRRTLECEFKIIVSPEVMEELSKHSFKEQMQDLIGQLKKADKVENFNVDSEDRKWASQESNLSHFKDRLHYAIARKAKAKFIVTRNWKDFCGLGSIPALPPQMV